MRPSELNSKDQNGSLFFLSKGTGSAQLVSLLCRLLCHTSISPLLLVPPLLTHANFRSSPIAYSLYLRLSFFPLLTSSWHFLFFHLLLFHLISHLFSSLTTPHKDSLNLPTTVFHSHRLFSSSRPQPPMPTLKRCSSTPVISFAVTQDHPRPRKGDIGVSIGETKTA